VPTGVPHCAQNRERGARGARQRTHSAGVNGVPHCEQYLPSTEAPHWAHVIISDAVLMRLNRRLDRADREGPLGGPVYNYMVM
jgi:hypothetical protein